MHFGNIPGVSKPVSRLVQGTATFFSPELADLALEYGFNTFDTGHIYGKNFRGRSGNGSRTEACAIKSSFSPRARTTTGSAAV